MSAAAFAYVQARLQADHGRLFGGHRWQPIEASRTLAQYLALVRQGPWADWLEGLDAQSDADRIERALSDRWHRRVADVARWLPRRWQDAVLAFGRLLDLPRADDPAQAAVRWLAAWPGLLPVDAVRAARLRRPAEILLPRLTGSAEGRGSEIPSERVALRRTFRRHATAAEAVFAHLALVALELERLRGGAVRRALLPPPGGEGTG